MASFDCSHTYILIHPHTVLKCAFVPFNNQLQAVMGNLELALDYLPPDVDPVKKLKNARRTAARAAEVSKRLSGGDVSAAPG
jgi:hypothetical protein